MTGLRAVRTFYLVVRRHLRGTVDNRFHMDEIVSEPFNHFFEASAWLEAFEAVNGRDWKRIVAMYTQEVT